MTNASTGSSGPVMQLLSSGLQLWIRQQCNAIESLDLRLEGSALGLLRGQLAGVKLMARGVTYRHLQLELVELSSSPIAVNIGNVLKGQSLQLQHPFTIKGQVSFTAAGLTQSFTQPPWSDLADQWVDALLGITPLVELLISQDKLVVRAKPSGEPGLVQLDTQLEVAEGKLAISAHQGELQVWIPLDQGISVERANLEGGMVQLFGSAQVSIGGS